MKRSALAASAAAVSAAGLSTAAAVLLYRLMHHGAVERAAALNSAGRSGPTDAATGVLPVLSASPDAAAPETLSGWHQSLPVTAVPPDTVTATATAAEMSREPGEQMAAETGRPVRTWLVNNSADWDGSPLELVVPPGPGNHRMEENGTPHV